MFERIVAMAKRRKNKKNKKKKDKKMFVKNQNVINTTPVETGPDFWETEVECISDCGKAPENLCVWIHPLAKEKIEILMEEYESIEWLAYLIGEFGEEIEVKDLFIPNQEITATSVDNIVCEEYNTLDVIGVIHSHHGMGNNFSGTDDTYINQNHNISLCISKDGIKGHVRWETPCGGYKIVESVVKIKTESMVNRDEFVSDIKEKIKKKTFNVVYRGGYPGYNAVNGYYAGKPGGYVNRHISEKEKEVANDVKSSSSLFTEDEYDILDKQVEELDFSKEKTVEEEMDLLNELDQISTDYEDVVV